MFTSYQLSPGDEPRWDTFINQAEYPSYRASIPYQHLQCGLRQEVATFLFEDNNETVAGVHYVLKESAGRFLTTADLQSGIMFTNNLKTENLISIVDHFSAWAKSKGASYMRITPWIPSLIGSERVVISEELNNALGKRGFSEIEAPRSTYWIDLEKGEDELLGAMRGKTRYDIKNAYKKGLRVNTVVTPDTVLIEKFWALYRQLGQSKGFRILTEGKFKNMVKTLLTNKLATLFVTKYNSEDVNLSLASSTGISSYLFGAIDPGFKNFEECPPPGNFAQWEMMRSMKAKGLKIYDLGFSPGDIPEKEHPQYEIWRFKYGFGGTYVMFLPVYGKVIRGIRGRLFRYLRYRK